MYVCMIHENICLLMSNLSLEGIHEVVMEFEFRLLK